jgi:hypothetical protein
MIEMSFWTPRHLAERARDEHYFEQGAHGS